MKERPLIGIITSRIANNEQQQLLSGMLDRARTLGADTVIFSNIYNFQEYFAKTEIENRIYDLIPSPRIDGLILTAESILNPELQQYIYERILRGKVPVVVSGAELPGLCCINNDVASDFADIARHLTELHHFTRFDFLTGPREVETSLLRVKGFRDALQKQGIVLPEENVIYGNFWTNSGEDLAMEYIHGKRRLPEAIVCANDYMAYGICDTFLEHGIHAPEDVTIIGYEYIGERSYHAPILTTYHRNRPAVGRKTMEQVFSMITGREPENIPVAGEIVCGDTCPCGMNHKQLSRELKDIRRSQYYLQLHFESNFEQQLTVSRNIKDYIRGLQDFAYLIRDAVGVYLCLYEDWCSENPGIDLETDNPDAAMLCYRIISPENGTDEPQRFRRNQLFPEVLPGSSKLGSLYFAPVFFAGRELGYFIIQYDKPDSYDAVFGDWLKVAANALESLRLKNDIRSLLECRNLSEFHDTTTGLYNRTGFSHEVSLALQEAAPEDSLVLVLIRTALFSDDTSIDGRSVAVRMESQIAECLKKLTTGTHEFCAKLSDRFYAVACVGKYDDMQVQLLSDKLETMILHAPLYHQHQGLGTLLCSAARIAADGNTEAQAQQLYADLQAKIDALSAVRNHNSYPEYQNLRSAMYREPQNAWDAQETCRSFHLSYGHFRATYKELFGISFHQDLIQSRISLAKHLLLTTSLSLQTIAFQCGYDDDKYFLRQFRKLTGFTPNNYRNT